MFHKYVIRFAVNLSNLSSDSSSSLLFAQDATTVNAYLGQRSTWFPTSLINSTNSTNIQHKHGDSFVLYDEEALKLKNLVDNNLAPFTYQVLSLPQIADVVASGVNDRFDYLSGNSFLSITGVGFTGATVTINGKKPVWHSVISDTLIYALDFPVASAGGVQIAVTNSDGTNNSSFGSNFTFRSNAITGTLTKYNFGGSPLAICSGPDGNLWAANWGGSEVWKITTAGVKTAYSLPGSNCQSICVGPDGNLWLADNNDKLWKVTTSGSVTSYAIAGAVNNGFIAICTGPDGNLWVTDANTFSNDGYIWKITTSGVGTRYGSGNLNLYAPIVVGADGNIWFVDNNNNGGKTSRLVRLITATGEMTSFDTGGINTASFTVGPDGNFYLTAVTDSSYSPPLNAPPYLITMNTAGEVVDRIILPFSDPQSPIYGPDGFLYAFSVTGPGVVGHYQMFRMEGTTPVVIADFGTSSGPGDFCVGPDGNIWASDGNGFIWKIS